MLDFLLRQLLDQAGWLSGLISALQLRCRAVSGRLKEIRRNLLTALCLWTLGFVLVAISLLSFAAMLVVVGWRDYPWQSLLLLSIVYAGAGVLLIRNSILRIS